MYNSAHLLYSFKINLIKLQNKQKFVAQFTARAIRF